MTKVLFVCMGNICRSPSAEAIFQHYLNKTGKAASITCDSAGVIGYHAGNPADSRMMRHAAKRGYDLTSISRQFDPNTDFDQFDWIIAMDQNNLDDLKSMSRSPKDNQKLHMMTDFCSRHDDTYVPDPYYGGEAGFEHVMDLLEDACEGLLNQID